MKTFNLVYPGNSDFNTSFKSLKEAVKYVEEARNDHSLNGECYITDGFKTLKEYPSVPLPELDFSKIKMSLYQFADLINEADDWDLKFNDIIEHNGWVDTSHVDQWSICESDTQKLEFDDNAQAVVLDK